MALKTDTTRTYERTITDHEDGTEYTLVFRKLSSGDISDRRTESVKIGKRGKGGKWSARAQDAFTIRRSVVKWDFPFPIRERDIMELDPDITAQINRAIAEINPSLADELRMFENDEDEDSYDETGGYDEGEYDEEAEAAYETNGNGHVEEVATEPIFTENEGPTMSAAGS